MFTTYTLQDWQKETALGRTVPFLRQCISAYKQSADYKAARTADGYFTGDRTAIDGKVILQAHKVTAKKADGTTATGITNAEIAGNRIHSDFFSRFVRQENSFLLGNGVTVADVEKEKLGMGFDTALASIGRAALIHGVAYGYWNADHLEEIDAYTDDLTGAFCLLDEMTGRPGVCIQYWQINTSRPMYARLFELDGVTVYRFEGAGVTVQEEKRPYVLNVATDALGVHIEGGTNYAALPVVPFFGNAEHRSELTPAIKTKIDLYDEIASDFGDNLERANDVYWVLNNFGGGVAEIVDMIEQINRLHAVVNLTDGVGGGSTAEPRTFEVPYAARQTAMELLEKALYSDAMALNMDEIRGGSLTNVAIKAAMTDLNLKCDAYEWEAFAFVQGILALQGIQTEQIKFKRRELVNDAEIVQAIYTMRADIDTETALRLNPLIDQEEIPGILANLDAQAQSGFTSAEELARQIDAMNE